MPEIALGPGTLAWSGLWSGLLLGLAACSGGSTATGRPASTASPPAVIVTTVEPQTVPIYGEYVGETEAAATVEIHSQVQGFLQSIAFKEGSIVQKGQLLFAIDPRPYTAVLDEAKATLALDQATVKNAQEIVNRYKPLAQEHAISQQQLDSAIATATENGADVQLAQAQLAAAQLNVDYTRIKAPMTGSIGTAQVKIGDLVQSGTTLLAKIFSISPMYVTFGISEGDYLAYIKRGPEHRSQPTPVQLILSDGSVYPETGAVNMVAPAVSTSTGTLGIRATFANPMGTLKPGLFARVRFVVRDAADALLVPQTAIQQLQGTASVYVVGPANIVQQVSVQTGATVGTEVIVNTGLKAGDRVIVEGTQKAQPGMPVSPEERPQQPPSAMMAEGSGTAQISSVPQSTPTPAPQSAPAALTPQSTPPLKPQPTTAPAPQSASPSGGRAP